jgi:hypothetical protein
MDGLSAARQFLHEHGRPLDRARFRHHFEGPAPAELLAALAAYQNPDGGFGHALEVDITAPDSNPFATELALLLCLQAQIPASSPLLQRAAAFLEATQDADGGWRFSPAVYEHELAPWFQGWEWPNLNPSCTLAGLLRELGLGSAALHERVAGLFARLARPADLASPEFYAVRPYAYYFLAGSDHPERTQYLDGLAAWLVQQAANLDGVHFFEYVRHPASATARRLPVSLINDRLDALIAEQQPDGGWPTPYNPAWRPWVTMQNLLVLQAFGRS